MRLRTALYLNCAAVLLLFLASHVALGLTNRNYCIVLFEVPFSNHSFELPDRAWSLNIVLTLSSVCTILISWIAVLARILKRIWAEDVRRRAAEGVILARKASDS